MCSEAAHIQNAALPKISDLFLIILRGSRNGSTEACNMPELRIAAGCQARGYPKSNAPIVAVPSLSVSTRIPPRRSRSIRSRSVTRLQDMTRPPGAWYGRESGRRDRHRQLRIADHHYRGGAVRGGRARCSLCSGMSTRPSRRALVQPTSTMVPLRHAVPHRLRRPAPTSHDLVAHRHALSNAGAVHQCALQG